MAQQTQRPQQSQQAKKPAPRPQGSRPRSAQGGSKGAPSGRQSKGQSGKGNSNGNYSPSAEKQRRNCEIAGVVLIALGVFFALTFMEISGIVGSSIQGLAFGLTGRYAYALPVVLIVYGIYSIALSVGGNLSGKTLLVVGSSLCVMAMLHTGVGSQLQTEDFVEFIVVSFRTGEGSHVGGGLFGALLSFGTLIFMGKGGTYLLYATLIVIQLIVLTNMSLYKATEVIKKNVAANMAHISAGVAEQWEIHRQQKQERGMELREMREERMRMTEEGLPPHDESVPRAAQKGKRKPFNFNELELGQMPKALEEQQSDFEPFSDRLPPADPAVVKAEFEAFERFSMPSPMSGSRSGSMSNSKPDALPKVPDDFCVDEPPSSSRFGSYLNYDFDAHGAPKPQKPAFEPPAEVEPAFGDTTPVSTHSEALEINTAQVDNIIETAPAVETMQTFEPIEPIESVEIIQEIEQIEPSGGIDPDYDIDAGEYERFLPPKPYFAPRGRPREAAPPAVPTPPFDPLTGEVRESLRPAEPRPAQQPQPQPQPQPQQQYQPAPQQQAQRQPQPQQAQRPPVAQVVVKLSHYVPPPLSLLKPATTAPISKEDAAEKAKLLEDTLASFGISAKVVNVTQGPVITRFELQPAAGVRVNRITNLADDLALNLAAQRVRIEAPIPGKAVIGIEIPNKTTTPVLLHELVSAEDFIRHPSKACVSLGKDIAGSNAFADLSRMPHLLIAGSTGSGKSVCINCIICSIIYHASPEDVKLIMVDPKVVELAQFANIPHLLIPVVTEPKKAASALKWAVQEMVTRYKRFAEVGARDLARFNELTMAQGAPKTPLIVVIVDELADLMMVAADDVEDAVCRIAQMGRAAGIHLVIATQRPSTDVITGLIKANVPSRIAFAVASATDSRIILDSGGAEKLLGRGDMLFSPIGASKPMRVQGALVTDEEVERIHEYFNTHQFGEAMSESIIEAVESGNIQSDGDSSEGIFEDELLPQAVSLFLSSGTASISMLQRRFRVGYARAARIVDIMEQMNIVSGFEGSKPRKLLINRAEYERIFGVPPEIADLGT